jgi:hypothetical protein
MKHLASAIVATLPMFRHGFEIGLCQLCIERSVMLHVICAKNQMKNSMRLENR